MGQVLHGSARTTAAIRRALQRSEESVRALARRYGISPTDGAEVGKRETTVADRRWVRPSRTPRPSALEQEAMIVAFRRHTLLPLDDCLYALQPSIPGLTRSFLHRCRELPQLPCFRGWFWGLAVTRSWRPPASAARRRSGSGSRGRSAGRSGL